ncbi:heme exporter protein CcmB [Neolewinella antarctica]|uniref:Heme exporter protein B n=1 Tax=Neolewinella antarctica TaxID=442734 RepID=A0ABX0XHD0_9BACT|nr:ABC transporter permease [Neolewinella antarctica]NJC28294.1 heme exporter protein B [Neolewinella antarctica]
MQTLRQIAHLLKWEFRAEWRNRTAISSVLLYVVATATIVYMAMTNFSAMTFNAVLWIVLFFGALVATGRSFLREGGRRHLYYYQVASPEALLTSKWIFNTLQIWLVSGASYLALRFFAAENIEVFEPATFLAAVGLGGVGLSAALTFVGAIAARAGGNATLMSILSLPILTPLLYLLVNLGAYSFGLPIEQTDTMLIYVGAIDLIGLAVGLVLFPFVWRD